MNTVHPMLQESWDEAAACAQMEYDQTQAAHADAESEALEAEPF